jgi:hypothetical protein
VLDTAGVENHSALRSAVASRRLLNCFRGYTRDSSDSPGIIELDRLFYSFKAHGMLTDKGPILEALPKKDVQEPHGQHHVCAGPERKIDIRVARDRCHSRVDDD